MNDLTVRDRFSLAFRSLAGRFTKAEAQAVQAIARGFFSTPYGTPPRRGVRQQLEHYREAPWLRAIVGRIAHASASTTWRLYTVGRPARMERLVQRAAWRTRSHQLEALAERGDLTELDEHPVLNLLAHPNQTQLGTFVRRLVQQHLELVGEAFLLIQRDALGTPMALWPLVPSWVAEVATPLRPAYLLSMPGWQGEVPATEVLAFTDPDPADPYGRGAGTAQALADELETDEFAAKHSKAWFYNRAKPDFMLWPKGSGGFTGDASLRRLEEEWMGRHEGFYRAYRPHFLNQEVGVHEFGQDFRAMQFIELRQHERDAIMQIFGMPPEIFGILQSSNRATIDASDFLFGLYVLTPRLELLREHLQERLVPQFDERLVLDYDSPLQEDRTAQLEAMKAAPWAVTLDEWRSRMGLEPLPEGGEQRLVPLVLAPANGEPAMPLAASWDLSRLETRELEALKQLGLKAVAK